MPKIILGLIYSGLLISMFPIKSLILGWLTALFVAGSMAVMNLFMWLSKLDAVSMTASNSSKMSFIQPIGPKEIAGFEAISAPEMGCLAIISAMIFAAVAAYLEYYKNTDSFHCYTED
jgi:hypothetical protein